MSDISQLSPESDHDRLVQLGQLSEVFQRRFYTFGAAVLLSFAILTLITLQTPAQYIARASLVLNLNQTQIVDFEAVLTGTPPDSAIVETQVEVLRSRALAARVVEQLNLSQADAFIQTDKTPPMVGFIAGLWRASAAEAAPHTDPGTILLSAQHTNERAIDTLNDSVEISRAGLTYVIHVDARSHSPQLARDIANAYVEAYLQAQKQAKFHATEEANLWLSERIETLREDVRLKERAVADYRDRHGLINAQGATIIEQQVADLNTQLAIQRTQASEARARLDTVQAQLERGIAADTVTEVLNSDVITALRAQQGQTRRRHADLSTRYGHRYPQIVTINRELEDIDGQIRAEIDRIVLSLDNAVHIADQRVAALHSALNTARQELAENNSAIVHLRELQREADASRALFEAFLNRFRQTHETQGLAQADASILAHATTPHDPSTPNIPVNLSLALLVSAMIGLGVIAGVELRDTGLHTHGDVERQLGLTLIASLQDLQPSRLSQWRHKSEPIIPGDYVLEKPLSRFC